MVSILLRGIYSLKNETDVINPCEVGAASIPGSHSPDSVEVVVAGAVSKTAKPPPRDEALMAYLDGFFANFMQSALVDAKASPNAGGQPNPDLEQTKARERFLNSQQAGKPPLNRAMRRGLNKVLGPERGLGPRVFIGFDAEWAYARKGRNRLLSVQFYVIGPGGEVLTKVIHIAGGNAVEERPRLSQAIYDLLEESLDDGVIDDWPVEVVLCGFFTRADITVFSDFAKLRPQLEGVGGTLVSVGDPAQLELPMKAEREAQLKGRYQYVVGDAFEPKLLSIRLIDASRLGPPGASLAGVGKWLGIPKIDLPLGYEKGDMARFQRQELEKFEAYGLRDAEIAVMYVLWVVWFSARYLGLDMDHLSATASGLAVRLAEACIRKDGVAFDVALNYEVKEQTRWNNTTNLPRRQKKRIPKRVRKWFESFLADVFVGGRNECFTFGPTDRKTFYDPDLSGAYLTALGYLFVLDYDGAITTKDVSAFQGHVAGYALVQFKFPVGTLYPCLPVAVEERGLLFPLSGESLCTAPEIELALGMGADIEIKFGLVIPWMDRDAVFQRSEDLNGRHRQAKKSRTGNTPDVSADSEISADNPLSGLELEFPPPHHDDAGYRLFESFAIYIREMRSRFTRKTLPFEFVKLLGNSVYGKTGQGFKNKRNFGPREMGSVIVGPSRISEAAVAGLVCGFIRAVIGEILWKLPPGATAVSATTDGFLVDIPLERLDLSGVMCSRFQALVDRLSPGSPMLENKHQVMQLFAGRTRLQVTTEADADHKLVTAKGGVKPGPEIKDDNAYMVDLICNREPGQKTSYESFVSMRDQLIFGYDLQLERHETKLNLEYDFKRRPIVGSARMVAISGTEVSHLAFTTEPWELVEEAAATRLVFDQWRLTHCLKNLADFLDWEDFRAFKMACLNRSRTPAGTSRPVLDGVRSATGRKNLTKAGYVGIAMRAFLAAYQKRVWGLAAADLSQRQLAEWLTEQGYKTSLSAVKNGTGEQPEEGIVPATDDIMALLNVLKARFPGLETERFLIQSG